MKAKVIKTFKDKHTGELHPVGEVLECTEGRCAEILSAGEFIEAIAEAKADDSAEEKERVNAEPVKKPSRPRKPASK